MTMNNKNNKGENNKGNKRVSKKMLICTEIVRRDSTLPTAP